MPQKRNHTKDVLLGISMGDALGVPVEFKSRDILKRNPVTDMVGFGTHHQPPGTWSDDSSLTFCLAEMLTQEFSLEKLATLFINWKEHGYWTAHGAIFDIGIGTRLAINSLIYGTSPEAAGDTDVYNNGNGSLMRVLPLLFILKDKNLDQQFQIIKSISSLTHGHIRAILCCFIYLQMAQGLLNGLDKTTSYHEACRITNDFLNQTDICTDEERGVLGRILSGTIQTLDENNIKSSGYVVHTLEASLWCLLHTSNYSEAVLMAVNLGDDSDTTAAVTGGLAALLYGWETIPANWLSILVKRKDIEDLADRFSRKLNGDQQHNPLLT